MHDFRLAERMETSTEVTYFFAQTSDPGISKFVIHKTTPPSYTYQPSEDLGSLALHGTWQALEQNFADSHDGVVWTTVTEEPT